MGALLVAGLQNNTPSVNTGLGFLRSSLVLVAHSGSEGEPSASNATFQGCFFESLGDLVHGTVGLGRGACLAHNTVRVA